MDSALHAAVCITCIVAAVRPPRAAGPHGPLPSAPGCPREHAAGLSRPRR